MRSSVNWALLGLVIERPSYAYELARRFERTYRDVLSLSSRSHVYTALGALAGRGYVEEVPGTRQGRQPKPQYRATAAGVESYAQWLVDYVSQDRQRQHMFVRQLWALAGNPIVALEILARYEQAWLAEAEHARRLGMEGVADDPDTEVLARIIADERRLTVPARVSWVAHLRREFGNVQGGGHPDV
jgi:DNA-binding PadR family transcriptional regulator